MNNIKLIPIKKSYYNYRNLVLYLLSKGADPYQIDHEGKSPYHIVSYYGRYECASLIINYEKHILRRDLKFYLKELMHEYKIKNSDVIKGTLVCPDKHLPETQERFEVFRARACELLESSLEKLYNKYKRSLLQDETLSRNPIHYASLSKYTK